MKKNLLLSITLLLVTSIAGAEAFDGSEPFTCEPQHGHDCLPTEQSCKPLKPESGKDMNLTFDVGNKTVKSPFRTALLPIQNVANTKESLALQGVSLAVIWSATIDRATGRLTIAIADRKGAYVVFGQCRRAKAPSVLPGVERSSK